ncbi:hypothetical protein [Vibrio gangliei]|uniref:hypothetical protein n=1 Tax=Vibrio gangliei TaxID=2077090 RepID=UPI000D01E43C|nr:hypothetical protein [Vibrio gangliei]
MSKDKNQDKDFDVLNEKVDPTISLNDLDTANTESTGTHTKQEDPNTAEQNISETKTNPEHQSGETNTEEPTRENENATDIRKSSDSNNPKWRWNFLNTILSLSALGAVSFLILVGNPLSSKSDTQVASNNIKDISKSVTALRGEVGQLSNSIKSKVDNETFLKERQKIESQITETKQTLSQVSLAMREQQSAIEKLHAPSGSELSSSELNAIKNDLRNLTAKHNEVAQKVASAVNKYNQFIETQKKKSTNLKSSVLLTQSEINKSLNGSSLLGINVTNGIAQSIFNDPKRGAYIAEVGEQVGDLTIIKITPDRVDVKSKAHKIGSLIAE